jgi:hypothetical protein
VEKRGRMDLERTGGRVVEFRKGSSFRVIALATRKQNLSVHEHRGSGMIDDRSNFVAHGANASMKSSKDTIASD